MSYTKLPPQTVLVVEDDLSIRETLQEALESDGYRVITAVNGRDGLDKIRQLPPPALVLLDMMMPILNGRQFLDAVQADADLLPIPVLVVSAIADAKNTQGASGFVKKPPDLEHLLQLVAKFTKPPSRTGE